MAVQNIVPQFPTELIEHTISTAWHMPLSADDRLAFMRSSLLVNSTWAALFNMVSSRHVYIPSSSFCDHFLYQLRASPIPQQPSFLRRALQRFQNPPKTPESRSANVACRSITIQIANADVHPDQHNRPRLPMGAVLDDLLETIDARSLAPNLRRVAIEYRDAGFDDVFQRAGLAALPEHVTHLDVQYAYSAGTPAWLVQALREKQERRRSLGWILPSITNLAVSGAGENVVRDMLRACPNTQTLVVDGGVLQEGIKVSSTSY